MERVARRLRLFVVTAVIALSLSAFAGTAAAATGPAPGTGLTGSCNMFVAIGVGANGGLGRAFVVENDNGWVGKWGSIAASGCPVRQ